MTKLNRMNASGGGGGGVCVMFGFFKQSLLKIRLVAFDVNPPPLHLLAAGKEEM